MGKTSIYRIVFEEPAIFDAVIVNFVIEDVWLGIPEITPESKLIIKPEGKGGLICHNSGPSPIKLGVRDCISSP